MDVQTVALLGVLSISKDAPRHPSDDAPLSSTETRTASTSLQSLHTAVSVFPCLEWALHPVSAEHHGLRFEGVNSLLKQTDGLQLAQTTL